MKIQDLHTLNIVSTEGCWIDLRVRGLNGAFGCSAAISFGSHLSDFENEDKALKAAALFRAAHKMQEALRQVLREEPHEMDGGRRLQYVLEALALSENTAKTVTPA